MTAHAPAIQFAADKEAHSDRNAASAERAISFGPFLLLPQRRLLLKADKPLRLGSRALDMLVTLVERPGDLVSKEELMARVWPNTFVVPANLTVHIAALRRALGDGRRGNRYFVNIPGRGYRFVTPTFVTEVPTAAPARPIATNRAHGLPARFRELIGGVEALRLAAMHLSRERVEVGFGDAIAIPETPGAIEIKFATGTLMRIAGPVDAATIEVIVTALARAKRR
jgi:DNA-binding winged helix-turn-helix (wHTH) protein